MDITKFFDGDDFKRTREKSNNNTRTSPGDVFEESLKSGDCVKILVSYIQNIEQYFYWHKKIRRHILKVKVT